MEDPLKYVAHPWYHLLVVSIVCSKDMWVLLGMSSFTFSIALSKAFLEIAMAALTIVIARNFTLSDFATLLFSSLTFSLSLSSMNFFTDSITLSAAFKDFTNMLRRVAQGTLTLTPSQNRTGASRLIRLLSSSRWCDTHFPMSKQGRFSRRDLSQPVHCPSFVTSQLFVFPCSPFCERTIYHIKEWIELRLIVFSIIVYPSSDGRIKHSR